MIHLIKSSTNYSILKIVCATAIIGIEIITPSFENFECYKHDEKCNINQKPLHTENEHKIPLTTYTSITPAASGTTSTTTLPPNLF